MDYKLDATHQKFIKMTVTGVVVKDQLISAIALLMQHPEYSDKNSYWDFTRAEMGLTMSDLKEIVGVLRLYKIQKKKFADKSALLVSGMMINAMVDMFVLMARALPFKYKVFTDHDSAVSFLCS